jgi:hypothetical protein
MRQQSTKCQWRIEKPLKFTRSFGYGRKNNNQDFIICPEVRVFPLESVI